MTVNESDNSKPPKYTTDSPSPRPGSKHEKLFPGDELFLNTLAEEQTGSAMDPAHELNTLSFELNQLSDLELPPDEPSENRQGVKSPDEPSMPIPPPVPPAFSGPATPIQAKQGIGLPTVLGAVAILAALSAIWLNKGLSDQLAQISSQQQSQPHEMDKLQNGEILALKQQIKAIEEQQDRQIQVLDTDVAAIKQRLKQPLNAAVIKTKTWQKKAVAKPKSVVAKTAPAIQPAAAKIVAKPVPTGGWVVNLASLASETSARKETKRLRAKGIKAEYAEAVIKGKTWYRVRIGGLASKQAAQAQKKRLARNFGIIDAWIGKP